jgi:hypothetical protein
MARKLEVELNAKSNADVVFGRAGRAANKFAGDVSARIMGAVAPMMLLDKGLGMVTGSIDKFANANIKARKLGVGFAEFYQLSQALEDTGVSEETTAKATKEMSIVLAEAQGGVETQVKALKDLGFTQEQISKGSITVIDLFMKLADATKSARSEAEKNNIVLSILGKKTGPELANALSMGATELKKNMGSASSVTDEMGANAEETQRALRQLKDTFDEGSAGIIKWTFDAINGSQRLREMKGAIDTVIQGNLDDAAASDVLARALIRTGEIQNKSLNQMERELTLKGEMVKTNLALAASPSIVGEDAAKRAIALQDQVIARAKEILKGRKDAAAADSTAKPGFQQFGATSMQALGGGYANARSGGPQNQPIGAMVGTSPLLPGATTTNSPAEQIFQDIRSIIKTIDGKIATPTTNQTRPSFRL